MVSFQVKWLTTLPRLSINWKFYFVDDIMELNVVLGRKPHQPLRTAYHHSLTSPFTGMTEKNYSNYQQKVIKRFYENRDSIALQRAQELVTELYLAEGKKREKVWDSLAKNLQLAGVPADQIKHFRTKDNAELVAKLLTQML